MSEHDKIAEAREALERITDYFDQRADAEAVGDPARYQGNAEMHLRRDAETVAAALAAARAQGAAEAFEKGAARCESIAVGQENARVGEGRRHEARACAGGAKQCAAAIRALAREAAK